MVEWLRTLWVRLRNQKHLNPFSSGAGVAPFCLVGRDEEILLIKQAAASISQRRALGSRTMVGPPMAPMKITGPSGFGKSALIVRAFQLAREKNVHAVYLNQLGNLSISYNTNMLARSIEGMKIDFQPLVPIITYEGSLSLTWSLQGDKMIRKTLKKKLDESPVIFLLDDVHDYHEASLNLLFGIVEEMMAQHYPVTMLMAGLPRMDRRLAAINIRPTSWSRSLRLKPLSKAEAEEALFKTFKSHGFRITSEALALMAEYTGNHPHFLQLVGAAVWQTSRNENRWKIDRSLVTRASAGIQEYKDAVYSTYRTEIKNKKLMPFAKEIVRTIETNGAYMTRSSLVEALTADNQDADSQEIADKLDVLQGMDFFWENAEQELEPGVPSIFDYIKRLK